MEKKATEIIEEAERLNFNNQKAEERLKQIRSLDFYIKYSVCFLAFLVAISLGVIGLCYYKSFTNGILFFTPDNLVIISIANLLITGIIYNFINRWRKSLLKHSLGFNQMMQEQIFSGKIQHSTKN